MTEKSPLDDDWLAIADDWATQPYKHVDVTGLIKKVRRRIFLNKLYLYVSFAAWLPILGGFIWSLVTEQDTPTMMYLGFGAFFFPIALKYEYKVRKSIWTFEDTSPEQVIQKAINERKVIIKSTVFNLYMCIPVFFAGNWYIWEIASSSGKSGIGGLAFFNVPVLVMIGVIYWFKLRKEKELKNLEDMVANKTE